MRRAILLLILVSLAGSCAKETPSLSRDLYRTSFDEWMKNNDPAAVPVGDIYIHYVEHNANASPFIIREDTSWVMINYTGRTLRGDIFITRNDSIARRLGVWANLTHYTDEFVGVTRNNALFSMGFIQAIRNLNVGDSARVYIPADKGSSNTLSADAGFLGTVSSYVGFPVMYDIRMRAITSNPSRFEMDTLASFARRHWGQEPRDTIALSIYMRKIKENPAGEPLTKDSTADFYYSQRFLDGFPITTNNDSLAVLMDIFLTDASYNVYSFKPFTTGYPMIYSYAVTNMRRGEIAEFATMSYWGIGIDGISASTTQPVSVGPYTPTIYRIYTLERDADGNYTVMPTE